MQRVELAVPAQPAQLAAFSFELTCTRYLTGPISGIDSSSTSTSSTSPARPAPARLTESTVGDLPSIDESSTGEKDTLRPPVRGCSTDTSVRGELRSLRDGDFSLSGCRATVWCAKRPGAIARGIGAVRSR